MSYNLIKIIKNTSFILSTLIAAVNYAAPGTKDFTSVLIDDFQITTKGYVKISGKSNRIIRDLDKDTKLKLIEGALALDYQVDDLDIDVVKLQYYVNSSKIFKEISETSFNNSCMLQLNFDNIVNPFKISVYAKRMDEQLRRSATFDITPGELHPVLDLSPILNRNDGYRDFKHISFIGIYFNERNPNGTEISFKLNSIELIPNTTVTDSTPVITTPVTGPVATDPIPIAPPTPAESVATGSNPLALSTTLTTPPPFIPTPPSQTSSSNHQSVTHINPVVFSHNNIDKTQRIELEEETQNPVPEPFSILTMGAGLTAFIRNKRSKKINIF